MKVKITATTDNKFLGFKFNSTANPIMLPQGIKVFVERVMPLPDGLRFISSSYIIDTQEA